MPITLHLILALCLCSYRIVWHISLIVRCLSKLLDHSSVQLIHSKSDLYLRISSSSKNNAYLFDAGCQLDRLISQSVEIGECHSNIQNTLYHMVDNVLYVTTLFSYYLSLYRDTHLANILYMYVQLLWSVYCHSKILQMEFFTMHIQMS